MIGVFVTAHSNNEEKTKEQLIEQYTKNMSKEDYKIAIEKCIDNIYSGEIQI